MIDELQLDESVWSG